MVAQKKILHLSIDDKFTDMALYYFELLQPNTNTLVVYTEKQPKFIRTNSVWVNKNNIFSKINIDDYDLVILHSLSSVWFDFIKKLPKNIPIVWIGWGYDYYDLLPQKLLLYKTIKISNNNEILFKFFSCIKKIIKKILFFNLPNKKKIIERIDYFAPVLESEYTMIKQALNFRKFPEYIYFNYGSLEKNLIKNFNKKIVNGNNILVGNSATDTNNHIEIFDLLNNLAFVDSTKIICPLSYGNEIYKKNIINIGNNILGERFDPLVEFMNIDDYISKIISCKVVIMNHVRQQAFGNIITMLYLGAKVFLREENPIYIFLKNKGAIIYSIHDLEKNHNLIYEELTDSDILKNQNILRDFISEDATIEKTRKIIALSKGKIK
ncbi:TDP-N-acetylfucosamine:lipid II N-acetylfucosaminyltransferase family protein [Acinetobacter sp. ANC 4640]